MKRRGLREDERGLDEEKCVKIEYTKILLLSETHQRPIRDPSKTKMPD